MPVHFRENQYHGVNAHLHSFLQNEPGGWWAVFHASHIAHLADALDSALPAGYYALNEKSLQIRRESEPDSEPEVSRLRPDVSIYGRSSGASAVPSFLADAPFISFATVGTLGAEEQDTLESVVIYKADELRKLTPVTRIEFLSPSNKPPLEERYLDKRDETLKSGINLIEIDYLHQTPSPVRVVPDYTTRQPYSYPYTILVNDLRESLEKGQTHIYVASVDDPIPKITIPLLKTDAISFDLGAVYNYTFAQNRFYGEIAVNYEELPMNFESYSEEDQARIRARMVEVR